MARPRPALAPVLAVVLCAALVLPASGLGADRRKQDEDRGKLLYERHCAACHGVRAGGDGPATQALVVPVPDLQGKVKPDKATIDLVLLGRGPMPGFDPSFKHDDARKVLIYMSKLTAAGPEPARPGAAPEADEPEGDAPDQGDQGDAQTPPDEDAPEAP